ncbi:hypothetical protein AU074_25890 [Pseudomonas sp. ATCC PTA-122608]|nr:hypothetical protein AU074_25890 [Pseudomonas sp. ATCC PTA-122608]
MRLNAPIGVTHNAVDPAHSRPKREARIEPEPVMEPAPAADSGVGRTDLNRQQPTVRKGTRQTGNLRF